MEPLINNQPPDLSPLFNNSKFSSKTLAEQRAILGEVEPMFNQISDDDYKTYRSKTKYPIQAVTKTEDRPLGDKVIDFLRPIVAGGMGAVTGAAASPFVTPAGGAAVGTAVNLLADGVMQRSESKPPSSMLSKTIGAEPGTIEDNIASTLENEIGGRAAGAVIKPLIKGIGAIKNTGGQIENAIADAYEQRFGKSKFSQALRSIPAVPLKKAAGQELTGPADAAVGELKKAYNITGGANVQPDLENVLLNNNSQINPIKDILSDPKKLTRALSLDSKAGTDATSHLREYVLRDTLNDPKAGVAQWNNPDYKLSLNKLFNGAEQARVGGFLDALNSSANQGKTSRYLTYSSGVGVLSAALLHGHINSVGALGTGLAAIKLGSDAMSRLITNPTTSRVITAAVKGAPLGVGQEMAASQIAKILQGTAISLVDQNGKEVKGHLDKENNFIKDE